MDNDQVLKIANSPDMESLSFEEFYLEFARRLQAEWAKGEPVAKVTYSNWNGMNVEMLPSYPAVLPVGTLLCLHAASIQGPTSPRVDDPSSKYYQPVAPAHQWTSEMAHAGYMVHQHPDIQCAECGAIYAAMEAERTK